MLYKTERLIIRKWKETDVEDLYEYCSNPEVTKYLTFPIYKSIEDSRERIAFMQSEYTKFQNDKNVRNDFAIELGNKVIGSIGWVNYRDTAGGIIELGYMLNSKYHRQGYMTEALVGMFKYIKEHKIAMRIEAKHDIENPASGNVMKRAGMTFEGILRKYADNNYHKRADMAFYSILYEEI